MISVVIPVYNRQDYIKSAVESVLLQSLKPKEIIVVDDGSTDKTVKVLDSFPNIRVITQENQGVSSARNRAIKEAKGKFLAFLDSDDTWHRDKLKKQFEFHKKNKQILISHTQELWIRDNMVVTQKRKHKKPSGDCFYDNIDFCKIAPSTVMIDKRVFDKVGYFDEDLIVCEDYDLWLRILKHYEIALIDEVLTTKYASNNQLSTKFYALDFYRIKSLIKHLPDYKVELEIKKKLKILKKGALKHSNLRILKFCEDVENSI